jgi:hypothetical protein
VRDYPAARLEQDRFMIEAFASVMKNLAPNSMMGPRDLFGRCQGEGCSRGAIVIRYVIVPPKHGRR